MRRPRCWIKGTAGLALSRNFLWGVSLRVQERIEELLGIYFFRGSTRWREILQQVCPQPGRWAPWAETGAPEVGVTATLVSVPTSGVRGSHSALSFSFLQVLKTRRKSRKQRSGSSLRARPGLCKVPRQRRPPCPRPAGLSRASRGAGRGKAGRAGPREHPAETVPL